MPEIYFPNNKINEIMLSLVQGFWLEQNEENEVVLLMKFEASILTKLISGCKFELIIRNPKLQSRGITLYVYDNIKDPLWITWKEFDIENKEYLGFDNIALKLIKAEQIRIVYYNHKNIPFFTTILKKENTFNDFQTWVFEIFNNNEPVEKVIDGYFAPENSKKGFIVNIKNVDCKNEPKINFHTPLETLIWDEELSEKDYYNFNDYLTEGKHGYNQEISIKSFLSNHFDINSELYYSPKKKDDNELIDFILCHQNAVILIESKNILSDKKTKLNKALIKAVNQLNFAEDIIKNNLEKVIDSNNLVSKLKNSNIIIRICLFNDTQSLLGNKTKNIIENFEKSELPIFISVTVFFQLIGDIITSYGESYKFNFIQNLIYLYKNFLESEEKIFIIREFKLHKK